MGRKKKVSVERTVSTRSTRQSTRVSTAPAEVTVSLDNNSQDSENGSISQDIPGEADSNSTNKSSDMAIPSLCHKKFGKYRCLMLGDSKYQLLGNSEVSGSDSETGSGVEVRIIDPCVSSESDSSSPPDTTVISNSSGQLKTFSKINHEPNQITNKSHCSKLLDSINCSNDSNSIDSDTHINLDSVSFDTQIPDPTLNIIVKNDPRHYLRTNWEEVNSSGETFSSSISNVHHQMGHCFNDSPAISETTEEQMEYVEESNPDEEVITVFQIIDENGTENLYYEIKTDDADDVSQNGGPSSPAHSSASNSSVKNCQSASNTKLIDDTAVISEFEDRLSNINITSATEGACSSEDAAAMECSTNATDTNQETVSSAPDFEETKLKTSTNHEELQAPSSNASEESDVVVNKSSSEVHNCEGNEANTDSSSCSSASGVRRSSRIKTISVLKQRSKGHGLVRAPLKKTEVPLVKEVLVKVSENLSERAKSSPESFPSSPSPSVSLPLSSPSFPVPSLDSDLKPVKVKSRWRRSSEMEMGSRSPVTPPLHSPSANGSKLFTVSEHSDSSQSGMKMESPSEGGDKDSDDPFADIDEDTRKRLQQFQIIYENEYHCDRTISKEARKMTCDCFLTKEEVERGEFACGEDCLNRLLMIECNSRCPVGDRCTNRRFQTQQYSNLRVINTGKKGLGLQAGQHISGGEFLMEYVGEVLNSKQFNQRAEEYSSDKNRHHYFMALKGDAVIDATLKGNISRFINHSCDPNSETQKWTVNGELRIGFFSKRDVKAGDEITFDYQFQRYGKEAQRCYCEASNCRGWIGEEPDTDSEEEEEESEDEKKPSEVKVEVEEGKMDVTEIKEEVKTDLVKDEMTEMSCSVVPEEVVVKKRVKPKKYARAAKELLEDVDLEEEMEMLGRSGVKNQSHTLSLCRAMVRAKRRTARSILLTLLARADLPCRRLFLDYRGLRLLAPWCHQATAQFRLDMLTALEKLPIPNKTILQECKLFSYLEKWLLDASTDIKSPKDESSDSERGTPVLIDEKTGLPLEIPFKFENKAEVDSHGLNESNEQLDVKTDIEIIYSTEVQREEIARLCKLLLDRWSQLKEIFKIPKKERIELMKEHERQANEPHSRRGEREKEAAGVGGSRRTGPSRWEERYNREERYSRSDREKKRSRPPSPGRSPDSSRRHKSDDRGSISKEERRREFAERAAREEQRRRVPSSGPPPPPPPPLPPPSSTTKTKTSTVPEKRKIPLLPLPGPPQPQPGTWIRPPDFMQNMPQPPHPFGPMMMNGMQRMPPPEYMMAPGMPNYPPMEYINPDYMQQNPFMMPYCGPPQQMYMMNSIPPQNYPPNPDFMQMMGPNPNFVTPMPPVSSYQNIPLPPPGMQQLGLQMQPIRMPPPDIPQLPPSLPPMPPIAQIVNKPPVPRPSTPPLPQPIPTLVPPTSYPLDETRKTTPLFFPLPAVEVPPEKLVYQETAAVSQNASTPTDENQETEVSDVAAWSVVRLPSEWRSMKDARGRTYYYHVKLRVPQWEPPLYSPTPHFKLDDSEEDEVGSSEEEQENEEIVADEYSSVKGKLVEGVDGVYQVIKEDLVGKNGIEIQNSPKKIKKKRPGLVTNCWIISPRREEDRAANQLELKRYKENKEKLKRRKEQALLAAAQSDAIISKYKKRLKEKHKKAKSVSRRKKEIDLVAEETARRIKEIFRSSMARVMVQHLNPFRREDCPLGRITNTPDFKHLARKLTHFVMLKELKHCKDVNDLECNDSVKQKAREFVKKYMAKFGPVYVRPPDEMD